MSDPGPRRFTMLDAIVLIAATGVGLVPLRETLEVQSLHFQSASNFTWLFCRFAAVAAPLMLCWTSAVAVCGLFRPRPPLRHMGRRPGIAAALVGSAWGEICIGQDAGRYWEEGGASLFLGSIDVLGWIDIHYSLAPAIFGAWAALGLAGAWEPDASWPDRAGRLLGSYWIIMCVLGFASYYTQ